MAELRNIDVYARTEWATAEFVPDEPICSAGPVTITFTQTEDTVGGFRLPPELKLISVEFELDTEGPVDDSVSPVFVDDPDDELFRKIEAFLKGGQDGK